MFEPAGLVRLFCLSHFLCPPSQFICAGLADVELGRSEHIFEQGWWGREEGSRDLELPAAAARRLPQPLSLPRKPAEGGADLLDESAT